MGLVLALAVVVGLVGIVAKRSELRIRRQVRSEEWMIPMHDLLALNVEGRHLDVVERAPAVLTELETSGRSRISRSTVLYAWFGSLAALERHGEEAMDVAESLLELPPPIDLAHDDWIAFLVQHLLGSGRWDEAEQALLPIPVDSPTWTERQRLLGHVRWNRDGEIQPLLDLVESFTLATPPHLRLRTFADVADAHHEAGWWEGARDHARRGAEVAANPDPGDDDLWSVQQRRIVRVLALTGDHDAALALLDRCEPIPADCGRSATALARLAEVEVTAATHGPQAGLDLLDVIRPDRPGAAIDLALFEDTRSRLEAAVGRRDAAAIHAAAAAEAFEIVGPPQAATRLRQLHARLTAAE